MIVATTETVAGYYITEHLGTVIGNTIRARHVGQDIMAGLRTIIGGEIKEYTGMLAESREQSLMRMKDKAKELGADAVVGVRFQTSMILSGTAELLVYGTAVKLGRK
ncbi:MAG: YbjQ family protein [Candidatus Marinimicrobia bacterium]|jgi:uncharacterized protein YbjQ (UPF0145 family)|nr:YbjQ family protein [Candidatus Neomarinimicrobiota bacterium]MBT3675263.1 YbjQ family protein [Candidatus Neomarinimicrobiota bacterium]MBT3763338.1 YbjQ family protein [Candidatus Neomarinimicrobiota bacterium]MBT4067680.1 YbjQ family protein [Candidatus Neomarinimicrobiota bacterium]MBT4269879.1 YbjQ family protein [Candidatus Neomarinimicrobiota bacterium]